MRAGNRGRMSLTGQTTRPAVETTHSKWETALRVTTIGLVTGLVVVGGLGFLGVRTADARVSGDGFEMNVHYAAVTRPALATPFSITVRSTDGAALPAQVTIMVSSEYLAMFDDNGMEPLPSESYNTATWTSWTFDVPEGRGSLTVDLDARLEPSVQWGRSAEARLEIDGEVVISVPFTTRVAP